ncbi:MAG: MarR family transcriptional regulator [Chloroflexota bacterium]
MPSWTFITSHGAVLTYIARNRDVLATDIASQAGLTERTVRRIIADLEKEGYIEKKRVGRANRYRINGQLPLRRPEIRDVKIAELLNSLVKDRFVSVEPV